MKRIGILVLLSLTGCGVGSDPSRNAFGNSNGEPPLVDSVRAPHDRDVMPDIRGARDIVFIRESMELPPLEDTAASSLAMRHLEAGVAAGFTRFEAELVRTANALSPDLPRMERYRILVMRVDELTGWDRPGVTPWGELED